MNHCRNIRALIAIKKRFPVLLHSKKHKSTRYMPTSTHFTYLNELDLVDRIEIQ